MYYSHRDNATETLILILLKNEVVLLCLPCKVSKNILTSLKKESKKRESKNTSSKNYK